MYTLALCLRRSLGDEWIEGIDSYGNVISTEP